MDKDKLEMLKALTDRAKLKSELLQDNEKKERCLAMIDILLKNPNWPDLKIGGWLEHIITVCIESGVTTIDEERNFSRPIKHKYYKSQGFDIPVTIDLSK